MKYLIALLATALGVAGVVLGEADDSPGTYDRRFVTSESLW